MTKSEFLNSVPDIIDHTTWGYGQLEVVADTKQKKGVCYRHKNNTASRGTYGADWLEVHTKLIDYLEKGGYIKNHNSSNFL